MKKSRIEFYVTPDGRVMYEVNGRETKEYLESNTELNGLMLELIGRQYPEALQALSQLYAASKPNKLHYDFMRVSRFIRCNFGKFDGLTFDVENKVLHIEEVSCPIKCECKMLGIICKPKPFGLTERETEVASMIAQGLSYDDISMKLGIANNTIKNTIQRVKTKLHLEYSKDIAQLFVTIL